MSRPDSYPQSLREDVGDAANVLVRTPTMEVPDGEGCARLLSPADLDGSDLLVVSLTQSPDERLAALSRNIGDVNPQNVAFVTAGDAARTTTAVPGSDSGPGIGGQTHSVESVSTPGDLTGLGIKTSSVLSGWENDGNDVVVCFHSLSTLLQYADVQQVFRFLHVLTGRFEACDAFAHFHLDPSAHDEKDVNTITALFDAVVDYDDGEWSVKTR